MSREVSESAYSNMETRNNVERCAKVEANCDVNDTEARNNVEPDNEVEERRFSAASKMREEKGFSLCGHAMRCFLALFVLTAALRLPAQDQTLPAGPMQSKATTACTECHEARIILQQRLSKAAWTKEVDKMTKWGALVDPADRDALIDYLSTNFSPDKPAYEPPRTSAIKNDSAKKSK
jgi:hypothetical protein